MTNFSNTLFNKNTTKRECFFGCKSFLRVIEYLRNKLFKHNKFNSSINKLNNKYKKSNNNNKLDIDLMMEKYKQLNIIIGDLKYEIK